MHTPPPSAPLADAPTPPTTGLERLLDRLGALAAPLALAVVLLLCLQWPLREWVGRGAALANDLAQWLFAIYVALALRHADRRDAHLVSRPDLRDAGQGGVRRLRQAGAPLALLAWAVFVWITGWPNAWRSLQGLENFPETANPGYFIVKLALLLLAGVMGLQALVDLRRALRPASPPEPRP